MEESLVEIASTFPVASMHLSHFFQLTALLGDLSHKTFVYERTQLFDSRVTCLLSNSAQAGFLVHHAPWLLPGFPASNHTLGSLFEFEFQVNVTFRHLYSQFYSELLPCDV